jgi:predicted phosphoribosyltransferase
MNFMDRTALGEVLARKYWRLRGKDAVIICLQESSILTCLSMARQLRAWVYPLIFAPVKADNYGQSLLGAYDQDGEFCPYFDDSKPESELSPEVSKYIQKQKQTAIKSIRSQLAGYDLALNPHRLDGRDVILAGDVITSPLPFTVAQQLIKTVSPKSISAAIGNVTPEVARQVRINADHVEILDILSGTIFDDNHYFEHTDPYTQEQKRTLTHHIATYWQ